MPKLFIYYYCVLIFVICEVQGYSFFLDRHRRQDCGFKCKNGECIDEDKQCDGIADCKDRSDETNACRSLTCQGFLYRCSYGGCIDADKECDGKTDCWDGSDEKGPGCNSNASSKCSKNEFECKSGECINNDNVCNGIPECRDNSDETAETCSKFDCPGYTFKCAYGACVDGNSECNGVNDCFDNSDENPAVCAPPTTSSTTTERTPTIPDITVAPPSGSCVLPKHPEFGHWEIVGHNSNSYKPGNFVKTAVVLKYKCKTGYIPEKDWNLCNDGNWQMGQVGCIRVCPKLTSTTTTNVRCTLNNATIDCSKATEGTIAEFSCERYFEDSSPKVRYCSDGTWNRQRPKCVPACGMKSVEAKPLVVGGKDAKVGDYPWHAALYLKVDNTYKYICGGSLVNQNIIITAAHCVTSKEGVLKDKSRYTVGVGKYYREYKDSRDTEAQYSEVRLMFKQDNYQGKKLSYLADIAMIITEKVFNLSDRVQPICLDEDRSQILDSAVQGVVIGWGYTEAGKTPSDVIKELTVPYIPDSQCSEELPYDFQEKYFIHDKMCTGYKNKNTSVCEGDSGGGLAFLNTRYRRYYIQGIVSVSPQTETSCNIQEYALYTRISKYLDFIVPTITRYGYSNDSE